MCLYAITVNALWVKVIYYRSVKKIKRWCTSAHIRNIAQRLFRSRGTEQCKRSVGHYRVNTILLAKLYNYGSLSSRRRKSLVFKKVSLCVWQYLLTCWVAVVTVFCCCKCWCMSSACCCQYRCCCICFFTVMVKLLVLKGTKLNSQVRLCFSGFSIIR